MMSHKKPSALLVNKASGEEIIRFINRAATTI